MKFFESVKLGTINVDDIKMLEKDLFVLNINVEELNYYYRFLKAFDHGFTEQRSSSKLRKKL